MLTPLLAIAFEWIAAPADRPFDSDKLLIQALSYCRQAGDGEAPAAVRARALENGWQQVWEDTSGVDTFEVVEDEIEWRSDRKGRLQIINVNFGAWPEQGEWRWVCNIRIDGESGQFHRQFLAARQFARSLNRLAGPDGLDRETIEALAPGERVRWLGDHHRLEFGRYGDEQSPTTIVTYSVAAQETK